MRCNLHIVCDRCRMVVKHAFKDCDGTTGGYYEVKGQWKKFGNPGERFLCDACMHRDTRYQAVYGN